MRGSTSRHYHKLERTLLLDEELELLRATGARTRDEVQAWWDKRYPHAQSQARDIIIAELYRRLCE